MSDELLRSHDGPVTRLTLNRPHKANALSASLVEALLDAVEYAATDGTRLLILEGAGRHFCAGFDFGDLATASDGDLALRFMRIEMLLQALQHAPHATLALAQGRVFGAGADLVACCGRRIATPEASFCMPGLRFGVVLGTRRLTELVGREHARDVLGNSRVFDAAEARTSGFLTTVAPQDEWPAAIESARLSALTLSPPATAALLRRSQNDTRDQDMAELARSVAAPGLKERIRRYRESGS
jgi:enoyl-CoA hydratase